MGDFQKLRKIAPSATNPVIFTSRDFRVIRFVLRLLFLQRP